MNKKIKKLAIYLLTAIILSITLILSYNTTPETLTSIDNRLRDYMFIIRGEKEKSDYVVIIDVDDKSIKEIGQWPWSRDVISNLLIELSNKGIGIIGFDVVFAEEDRTSPHKILNKFNIKSKNKIPNYDEIFAETIANTPTILGYQFQMEEGKYIEKKAPFIKATVLNKNKNLQIVDSVLNAKGSVLNTPLLQEVSYSSGFFNNVPDPSGIVRSVPMIINYKNETYTSLSLEIVRAITGVNIVKVFYSAQGVEQIEVGDYVIPTDEAGRLLVNYRGKEGRFEYISAIDILKGKVTQKQLEGKIALVGTSASSLLDLRATPFESIYPGVEVHANAIDNILRSEFISKPNIAIGADITIVFLLVLFTILAIAYVPALYIPFALGSIAFGTLYYIYYSFTVDGVVLNILYPILSITIASIVTLIISYFLEKKNELLIKKKFASKVSKEVMDSLLENSTEGGFEAMDKEITVFFSDVRSFTSISESMENPRDLIDYLNEYMTPMSDIIIEEKGTIDKYIGDAIMAYWNAPGNVQDHPDKALSASIRQIEYLIPLNKKLKERNLHPIDIGIGLNTGIATVGEMGSEQRSDYTCIGDPINLGARLESLCKGYGAKIIISEFVKDRLKNIYQIRNLDLVKVKGKNKPVEIFEVYSFGETKGQLKEELDLFNEAVKLYRNSNFIEALEIFTKLLNFTNLRNETITKTYINRCENYIKNPPVDFDGVYTHTTKG